MGALHCIHVYIKLAIMTFLSIRFILYVCIPYLKNNSTESEYKFINCFKYYKFINNPLSAYNGSRPITYVFK